MAKRGSKLAKKAKKKGVAHSKMKNIQNLKRIKNKEFTPAEKHARKEARKERKKVTYSELRARKVKEMRNRNQFDNEEEVYPLSAEVTGEEMMRMIEQDDLDYLVEKNKDASVEGEQQNNDASTEGEQQNKDASTEGEQQEKEEDETPHDEKDAEKTIDGEEDGKPPSNEEEEKKPFNEEDEKLFEREERSFHPMGNDMKYLLPFKTKDGLIGRYTTREVELGKAGVAKPRAKPKSFALTPELVEEDTGKKDEPEQKSVVELMADRQLILDRKKVSIGCLAVNFLELPQERMHCLSNLIHMLEERDQSVSYTVRKYASLSLLEVFHKTIPAYHIEPHDVTQKLKKDTKEQYIYENYILKTYQAYLKELERFLKEAEKDKGNRGPAKQLAMVSLKCMGDLLVKHSYFTYTNNIINALAPYLNHKDDEMCHMVVQYFNTLFKEDITGDVSLEAVKRIDHYVRKRAFNVRIDILSVLLSLRIKNVKSLDDELEAKNTAKKKLTHTEKLMRKLLEEKKPKKSNKEARRFRKFRKLEEKRKEHKLAEQEEVRTTQHTQVIEILFGLYFHILKRRPNNNLNGIVLEGLAKFSHLVNVEFFSDLLNVLGGLMEEGTLKFRESLHCIQTVFTILSDQGEVLTLDPRRFYLYLYGNLFNLSAGENQDDAKSAFVSLMQMLVIRRKRVSAARVQAFVKRLVTLSLELLHNGAISALATARYIMLTHPTSEVLLEMDVEGACGVFSPEIEEPENSNAASSTLWELHMLNRHYHNTVRQFAQHLTIGAPLQGDGQLPPNIGKRRVEDLYDDFDPATMKFNPAIASPSEYLSKRMYTDARNNAKRQKIYEWNTQFMRREIQNVFKGGDYLSYISPEHEENDVNEDGLDKKMTKQNGLNKKMTKKMTKQNGLNKKVTTSDNKTINYFSGLLPNMDLSKIKITDLSEIEDATISLINVDHEAC